MFNFRSDDSTTAFLSVLCGTSAPSAFKSFSPNPEQDYPIPQPPAPRRVYFCNLTSAIAYRPSFLTACAIAIASTQSSCAPGAAAGLPCAVLTKVLHSFHNRAL